jgi:hypothetical protein
VGGVGFGLSAVISTELCDERSNQAAFGNMGGYVRVTGRVGFLPKVEMTGGDQITPRHSHGLMNVAPSRGANRSTLERLPINPERVTYVSPLQRCGFFRSGMLFGKGPGLKILSPYPALGRLLGRSCGPTQGASM